MTLPTTNRMTPLARFLDSKVQDKGGLATFLAVHRIPGPGWKSFDEIADELTRITETDVNRVSVKTFSDGFGIPDTRYTGGRKQPTVTAPDLVAAYVQSLDTARINIDKVQAAITEAEGAVETPATADTTV